MFVDSSCITNITNRTTIKTSSDLRPSIVYQHWHNTEQIPSNCHSWLHHHPIVIAISSLRLLQVEPSITIFLEDERTCTLSCSVHNIEGYQLSSLFKSCKDEKWAKRSSDYIIIILLWQDSIRILGYNNLYIDVLVQSKLFSGGWQCSGSLACKFRIELRTCVVVMEMFIVLVGVAVSVK